jgi:hypothetical protein
MTSNAKDLKVLHNLHVCNCLTYHTKTFHTKFVHMFVIYLYTESNEDTRYNTIDLSFNTTREKGQKKHSGQLNRNTKERK